MKIIEQDWDWVYLPTNPLDLIEQAGRTCYKSEAKMTENSAKKFVAGLLRSGHHSVIEHPVASVRFITDRGVTHELVRHRLASYSQESTRYCNYGGDHISFIRPVWVSQDIVGTYDSALSVNIDDLPTNQWLASMFSSEVFYKALLREGWKPEQARSVLPNSLKTEIVVTANLREWRHIFNLRCSAAAHPQIRELMLSCLSGFREHIPVLFDDIYPEGVS